MLCTETKFFKANVICGRRIYSLQTLKKNFDAVKEKLNSILLWIRLLRLPLEMWNDKVLWHILVQSVNLLRLIIWGSLEGFVCSGVC